MSPEQQRIKIAEACGWKNVRALRLSTYPSTDLVGTPPINQEEGWEQKGATAWILPNYLSDLNAMHEAEKVLTPDQFPKYLFHLRKITQSGNRYEVENSFFFIHATAAQRAEAILCALNLWDDNKCGNTSATHTGSETQADLMILP